MFHRFHTGTWQRRPSGRVPTCFIPVRVARATVTMAVLRICALLLLFDCQEAFHCCLVVACINRINMISIECHRSGERCPGKREFDNRIEINRVRSGEIMWLFPLIFTTGGFGGGTPNNTYSDNVFHQLTCLFLHCHATIEAPCDNKKASDGAYLTTEN